MLFLFKKLEMSSTLGRFWGDLYRYKYAFWFFRMFPEVFGERGDI